MMNIVRYVNYLKENNLTKEKEKMFFNRLTEPIGYYLKNLKKGMDTNPTLNKMMSDCYTISPLIDALLPLSTTVSLDSHGDWLRWCAVGSYYFSYRNDGTIIPNPMYRKFGNPNSNDFDSENVLENIKEFPFDGEEVLLKWKSGGLKVLCVWSAELQKFIASHNNQIMYDPTDEILWMPT